MTDSKQIRNKLVHLFLKLNVFIVALTKFPSVLKPNI